MAGVELLPCPFCGGDAELFIDPPHRDSAGNRIPRMYGVRCMSSDGIILQTVLTAEKQDAITAWNRRTFGNEVRLEGDTLYFEGLGTFKRVSQ